eukprot:TRINITY_DN10217_c0_g1_i3.p1 TRINITY_DN10217_c0_g1~~TRINITY_DN10217_c0_g1_i3.p1  ORF type:complete len:160 (-),score=8.15 TRINITY_DN10217_c0_g1_i3:363-842(-)
MVRLYHVVLVSLVTCCSLTRISLAARAGGEVQYTDFVHASELSSKAKLSVRKLWLMSKDSLTLSLAFSNLDWGGNLFGYAFGRAIGMKPGATYYENYFARAKLDGYTIGFVQMVIDHENSTIGHVLNLCKGRHAPKGIGLLPKALHSFNAQKISCGAKA